MKTLDQIEPRTDVTRMPGNAFRHILITNTGSYYLSTNPAVTKDTGIYIAAPGVTLDLNGFEIARCLLRQLRLDQFEQRACRRANGHDCCRR
jgi:hypothetical protein